jgi:AcrR family transcriptional regulator
MTDKRQLILNSTLKLISERGFHDSPISIIAKKAGVSVGTIYHYFTSKEQLIFALYDNLKLDFSRKLMAGYSEKLSLKQNLKIFWMNTFDYYFENPTEINYLEQYDHSPNMKEVNMEEMMGILAPFFSIVTKGIAGGKIKDLNIYVIIALTVDVAISLSKKHIKGEITLDDKIKNEAFDACWSAITLIK